MAYPPVSLIGLALLLYPNTYYRTIKVADVQSGVHSLAEGLTAVPSTIDISVADLFSLVKQHDKVSFSLVLGTSGKAVYDVGVITERDFPNIYGSSDQKAGAHGGNLNERVPQPGGVVKWSSRASEEDIKAIFMATKKRVTATQFASSEAIANTSRSPRFDKSVPQTGEVVKWSSRDVYGDSI